MPFGGQPRERVTGTGLACRLVVAARLRRRRRGRARASSARCSSRSSRPRCCWTTPDGLRAALAGARSTAVDAAALVAALADAAVEAAYQADRALSRTAAGSPDRGPGPRGQHRRRRALHRAVDHLQRPPTAGAWRSAASSRSRPMTRRWPTSTSSWSAGRRRGPGRGRRRPPLRPGHPRGRRVHDHQPGRARRGQRGERALIAAAAEGRVRREALGTSAPLAPGLRAAGQALLGAVIVESLLGLRQVLLGLGLGLLALGLLDGLLRLGQLVELGRARARAAEGRRDLVVGITAWDRASIAWHSASAGGGPAR